MQTVKRHRFSLTARLMLCYMIGCVVSLAGTAYYVHSILRKQLEEQSYDLMISHITMLRNNILENADDPLQSTKQLIQFHDQHPIDPINGRLVNAEGQILFSTAAMESLAPAVSEFPAKPTMEQDLPIISGKVDPVNGGKTYWLATKLVGLQEGGETTYQARYVCHHSDWLTLYDNSMMLAIAVGGVCSALVGWLIARNGLNPLFQITRSLKKITAHDVHESTHTDGWPREVSELACEFDRVLTRLQNSFRQLSQFTADAAHEFRTPLNNLMGATSLALSKERSPEQYQALLQSHIEQYTRLNRMIESLLFLARADNTSTGFQLQSVDLGACARDVLDFFSAVADERGVILKAEGEATVMADESMLRIALSNLVSNGLRFTPAGKTLRIRVERNSKQDVVASVIDSGPGIAPEHYAHIFDRYYRLEKSRSTEGAGLGLSIVQTIMHLHGGSALVGRDAGGGAVFSLVFPKNATQSADAKRTPSR